MMNKKLFIGLGMIAFLASCSSDDNIIAPADDNSTAVIGNSDVEIKLSSGSQTRASIESSATGVFEAKGLGVFCLAKNDINRNPEEQPIVWQVGSQAARYSIWMNNVKTDAVYNADSTLTNLVWQDSIVRYYPVGNWHAYRFYGYYPYNATVKNVGNTFVVDHELDVKTDLIWGRTENLADTLGDITYSAKYFRQAGHGADVPSMKFQHKLMRLTFSIAAGKDANGSIESAKTMGVKSIQIHGVPYKSTLVIADKANQSNEGKISFDWTDKKDFFLPDTADIDTLVNAYMVQDDTIKVGQGMLLPVPPADDSHKYTLSIVLVDTAGVEFPAEYPMDIRFAGGARFAEGKSYNILLTINGPKEIKLSATLKEWDIDSTTLAPDGIEL